MNSSKWALPNAPTASPLEDEALPVSDEAPLEQVMSDDTVAT